MYGCGSAQHEELYKSATVSERLRTTELKRHTADLHILKYSVDHCISIRDNSHGWYAFTKCLLFARYYAESVDICI